MRQLKRVIIALFILVSGFIVTPYAALPSEVINWQQFATAYVYQTPQQDQSLGFPPTQPRLLEIR